MKILHLARDEKFVPLLQRLFEEALPGAHHWLIAQSVRSGASFVQPAPGVTFRKEWLFRTPWIARDVRDADVIVAHSMTTIFANAIRHAPAAARVAWIGWGYDYYPLLTPLLGDSILPATRALCGTPPKDARGGGGFAAWWRGALRKRERRSPMALTTVASRLHTFCVMPTEVELLRQALPALRGTPHELPLFTAEDVFERGPAAMAGPDILLGNSATASNNHADALELLRGRIGDGHLIVPLSYGDSRYGAQVAALGRQCFGDRFEPLQQWMPIDAYNERIGSCGFVVMNHRRQQAVGNIGAALYKGATVYLRRENPLYPFYCGLGIALRPMEALAQGSGPLQPLTAEERARNRALIGAHYARERVLQAIRELPALQS
ncbi:TDP-N-acetylfucosamine:lipid II N-acetylfucosaminyltransferase [Azohydromonas aeria]|uniref:TDP-N-acetylfucosamine:lipid II N-acetylfucosaminyltransferase n=1 Tax=Azohydromonas aeria TaxID=2590212 RepID=UPI0012FACE51|nr:TDP-N-acetylfucosamine:lipid II N-acetylfucosaminyltransferase [Azohydromonas aeria]